MSNVIAFTPRPRAPLPPTLIPLAGIGLRAHLEEAAQTALDGEGEGDTSLTAMATHAGQVVQLREAPAPVEAATALEPVAAPQEVTSVEPETPETAPQAITLPEPYHEPIRLPWRGAGNVVAAAGCAVLSLVVGMR